MQALFDALNLSILTGAALVLLSLIIGISTSRTGLPLLLIFLAMGMLAGEDGIGGIVFNDYRLSFWVGNIALAVILLDGGLRTEAAIFRIALKPALWLASLGVIITCAVMALIGHYLLGLSLAMAFLFGAIVSSTDAAAVFSLFKSTGLRINERVSATLEAESGFNDPMAVLLTVVAIGIVLAQAGQAEPLRAGLVFINTMKQIFFGLLLGVVFAYLVLKLIKILRLQTAHNVGLNAIFLLATGLCVFAISNQLGGSGFLSIYIFGVLIGNTDKRLVRQSIPALDGLAWLFQSAMFLILGLLATPSQVLESILMGLVLSFTLIFVARPLAVMPLLTLYRYSRREQLFIAWVGLRGAVPIVLAIYPIMASVPGATILLNLAFVVVFTSLLLQGASIQWLAHTLRLTIPKENDERSMRLHFGDFVLQGAARMQELAQFYSLPINEEQEGHLTLSDWLELHLAKPPVVGDIYNYASWSFVVKELEPRFFGLASSVSKVGIKHLSV